VEDAGRGFGCASERPAEHYRRSRDQIIEEELRQYFLFLANEKQVARAIAMIACAAT
jgi:hypothetical protein